MAPLATVGAAVLLLLPLVASAAGERGIVATGGGVAPVNTSMVLKYQTGQDKWNTCFWYRFEGGKEEYCMYLAVEGQPVKQATCKPESLGTVMRYTGNSTSECTITVDKLTEADDCGWEVRVDAQRTNRHINVTVALPVTSIDLTLDPANPLQAGQDVTIVCKATGGRPDPALQLVSGPSSFKDVAAVETKNDTSKTSTLQVKPTWKDHGATINCTSVQVDGNNNPLFESLSKSLVLNVTYPPQPVYRDVDETNPVERTHVEVTEGGNQTVTVVVKANPDPTYFKWTMTYYMDPATNKTKDSVELNNEDTDKYSMTVTETEPLVHELKVSIYKATPAFWNGTLQLVTENSLGKRTYYFDIKVKGKDEGGNDGDGKGGSGGGMSGGVVAIIVIIVVLALLIGSVFAYKKLYARNNETAPLR